LPHFCHNSDGSWPHRERATNTCHTRIAWGLVMGLSIGTPKRQSVSLESFNHDGVQIARRRRRQRELPLRQVAYFLIAVVSFKIFLFFDMGAGAYGAKIDELMQGTKWERAAGWAMQLDPASQWVVDGVRFGRW